MRSGLSVGEPERLGIASRLGRVVRNGKVPRTWGCQRFSRHEARQNNERVSVIDSIKVVGTLGRGLGDFNGDAGDGAAQGLTLGLDGCNL